MSYQVQKDPQQKSVGLFMVFAFHALLFWVLATGLMSKAPISLPDPTKVSVIEERPIDPEIVTPEKPLVREVTAAYKDQPPVIEFNDDIIRDVYPDTTPKDMFGTTAPTLTKPSIKRASKPDYPTMSSRLGESGTTGLNLYINADGRVTEANIASSSGYTRLDDAAIKHAIRNWVFTPCTENGKAVACWHQTKLVWRLEDR